MSEFEALPGGMDHRSTRLFRKEDKVTKKRGKSSPHWKDHCLCVRGKEAEKPSRQNNCTWWWSFSTKIETKLTAALFVLCFLLKYYSWPCLNPNSHPVTEFTAWRWLNSEFFFSSSSLSHNPTELNFWWVSPSMCKT